MEAPFLKPLANGLDVKEHELLQARLAGKDIFYRINLSDEDWMLFDTYCTFPLGAKHMQLSNGTCELIWRIGAAAQSNRAKGIARMEPLVGNREPITFVDRMLVDLVHYCDHNELSFMNCASLAMMSANEERAEDKRAGQ